MNVDKIFKDSKSAFAIIMAWAIVLALAIVVLIVLIDRPNEVSDPKETDTSVIDTEAPVTEHTTAPVTEPITEPATEPSTEPITSPVTEPTTEPITEPVAEATTAPPQPADAFTLNRTDFTLMKEGSTWKLYKGTVPTSLITFTSDDPTVATFVDGVVTAVGVGKTRVYAEYNGEKLSCIVRCRWETVTEPEQPTVYVVTFKDWDGTVLKTENVEKGKDATAPSEPVRESFNFAGWDKSFNNVTSDLIVTATYSTSKIVICAESVTVNKGTDEVTINIRVYNNPGIMGAILNVSVNDSVFSFSSASNTQYPSLILTYPGPAITSSPYIFMLDALKLSSEDKKDGILFSVTFKIDDPNAVGTYDVKLSYNNKAIFDENYFYHEVVMEDGTITIK